VKRTKVNTYEKPKESGFPENAFVWDDKDDAAMIESMEQTLSEIDTENKAPVPDIPETAEAQSESAVEASSS